MGDRTKFGKYTVLASLGAGGMAEAFKCRLEGLGGFDKTVVVKRILPQHVTDQEFVQMFLNEARVAAHLNHSNIVHVYEIDQVDGVPHIAMEWVRGPSMALVGKRSHKRAMIHLGHIAWIMAGVCRGLHHAHQAQDSHGEPLYLVHRDVSPQNIVVSSEGVPKLLDFGIAKSRGSLVTTQAGTLKGKLGYMSPEQLEGAAVDHRSDIFAAGVCLYLLTVGKKPFHGTTEMEIIAASRKGVYPKPSELVPDFPTALEEIIVTALQTDPCRRFPHARAMAERLEEFTATGPYASSKERVLTWLNELFPEGLENASDELPPGITPAPSVALAPAPQPTLTPAALQVDLSLTPNVESEQATRHLPAAATTPPRGNRRFLVLAGTVLLVLVGSGVYFEIAEPRARPGPSEEVTSTISWPEETGASLRDAGEDAAGGAPQDGGEGADPPPSPGAGANKDIRDAEPPAPDGGQGTIGRATGTGPKPRPPATSCSLAVTRFSSCKQLAQEVSEARGARGSCDLSVPPTYNSQVCMKIRRINSCSDQGFDLELGLSLSRWSTPCRRR